VHRELLDGRARRSHLLWPGFNAIDLRVDRIDRLLRADPLRCASATRLHVGADEQRKQEGQPGFTEHEASIRRTRPERRTIDRRDPTGQMGKTCPADPPGLQPTP
jgi:hypothetical protein